MCVPLASIITEPEDAPFLDFITLCLAIDPAVRMRASDALNHPFLASDDPADEAERTKVLPEEGVCLPLQCPEFIAKLGKPGLDIVRATERALSGDKLSKGTSKT